MKKYFIIIFISFLLSDPFDGLTLITSMGGGQGNGNQERYSHLINNNQDIINSWSHDTGPSSIAYITPDSILYVPCKINNQGGGGQGGGPPGGRFKKMDWGGNIIWDYILPDSICIPHHDIAVLPNGNILAICSETKTQEEALNAGISSIDGDMTLDMIVEIEPVGYNEANIIWEWHLWDHLIQDTNSNLPNFGIISENPQLLNINCNTNMGGGNGNDEGIRDWNHCNCISYNQNFNQIVLSSRHMNEFYIIDHSTTTEESQSHQGGNYNRGGDFLYRWGNPQNYHYGNDSNQILFSQHGVNWIPNGYPGEGNFILFNNNHSNNNSAVLEISPPIDAQGNYFFDELYGYGPESYSWIHQSNFYSNTQSGAFRLANGNTIITATNQQSIFEINDLGVIEWSYQGNLSTARAIKYGYDFFQNSQILGDVNNDFVVNILDVVQTVNIVLGYEDYNILADLNNDSDIDILDVVQLISIILD